MVQSRYSERKTRIYTNILYAALTILNANFGKIFLKTLIYKTK